MAEPKDIETSINETDKGDETLKRYRYQFTYAAIAALTLLETKSETKEVFCEHHEDVLIKLKSNKFVGIQVKTRSLDQAPFVLDDKDIVKSLSRFVELETSFPDKFDRFVIVSNAGFFKDKSNSKSVSFTLELAKEGKTVEILKPRTKSNKVVSQIAKKVKVTSEFVVGVLAKTNIQDQYSSLNDIKNHLTNKLNLIDSLRGSTQSTLVNIGEKLIYKFMELSSLEKSVELVEHYIQNGSPEEEKVKEIIKQKRLEKVELLGILNEFKEAPITILPTYDSLIQDVPYGTKRLEQKMDRGGISYENVQLQRDHKYSVESHLTSWLHKYDTEKASKLYNQAKLIVKTECQESYDEFFSENDFGQDMLKDIRKRLRLRKAEDNNVFHDMSHEHILGLVGVLTEECKIWWSKKFEIK